MPGRGFQHRGRGMNIPGSAVPSWRPCKVVTVVQLAGQSPRDAIFNIYTHFSLSVWERDRAEATESEIYPGTPARYMDEL